VGKKADNNLAELQFSLFRNLRTGADTEMRNGFLKTVMVLLFLSIA